MFRPVRQGKIYVQIADQIRQLIESGALKPGEKLPPERALAQAFQTSRASVREALSALEIGGYVICRPGSGTTVAANPPTSRRQLWHRLLEEDSPYDIYEARLILEPHVAALAAERATDDDRERLHRAMERILAAGRSRDPDEYNAADQNFHRVIAQACRNEVLSKVALAVNACMSEELWKNLKAKALLLPGRLEKYTIEHEQICRAIVAGDVEQARQAMYHHIKEIEGDVFAGAEEGDS